jgi:hypothetical protein
MSTAVVQDSDAVDGRVVQLGDSLNAFLREIGMQSATGGRHGSITRVRKQIQALAGSIISVEVKGGDDTEGFWAFAGVPFAEHTFLAWSQRDPDYCQASFGSTLTLSQQMYTAMKDGGVPIDARSLNALRKYGGSGSGGAFTIDIDTWLAHRLPRVARPTVVTWAQLALQFGSQYGRPRAFKENFVKQLPVVLTVYPGADVAVLDHGLLLKYSPPPVARSAVTAKRKPRVGAHVTRRVALGYVYGVVRDDGGLEYPHLLERDCAACWTVYDGRTADADTAIAEHVSTLAKARGIVDEHIRHLEEAARGRPRPHLVA